MRAGHAARHTGWQLSPQLRHTPRKVGLVQDAAAEDTLRLAVGGAARVHAGRRRWPLSRAAKWSFAAMIGLVWREFVSDDGGRSVEYRWGGKAVRRDGG